MLSAIRAFAKSWVAAVLIGILIVSFAIFGIRDVFKGHARDAVIIAGSRVVSSFDFRKAFEEARKRAEQQVGQPVTAEFAAQNGLDRQVLQGLAAREAFAGILHAAGITPSDKLVVDMIGKLPAFFDPVSGRFDKKQYMQRLAQIDLTPEKFEASLRDEMAEQHTVSAMMNGMQAPRAYSAMAAIFALESRDISYLEVGPGAVPPPAPPTEAQLQAFMKENASRLTLPEFRVLTVVRFSPQMVAAAVQIDPAEVRKRYDFRKDTLGTPETRTVIQVPAKDAQSAQAVAKRLAAGEAPGAVAKSAGVDAITYDNKPQSAIPDHKVATAAFQMQPGQVSTVQGDLGLAVLKVVAVTPAKVVSFEEARPGIEAEMRKDAAAEKVYSLTEAYDQAHEKGANLAEAAQKAGVPAITMGPVTKDGRDQTAQPAQGVNQKLLDTAFSLPAGGESEVVDAGGGEYFAVRVEKIIPPATPPFEQIKPDLTRAWMMREQSQAMEAKAEEIAARLKKGESFEAVAAATGSKLVRAPGLDRQSAQQNQVISQEILGNAFAGKPGEVFIARARTFGYAVGKVDAIRPGDPAKLAQVTEQVRPQMSQTLFREIGESAQSAAAREMKVKIDYNRAREAIGLTALDAQGKPETPK
jgi:peptidyl-prolyl cis-trans isomerase D